MSDSADFALHRPELLGSLIRGEEKIARLMRDHSRLVPARTTLIEIGQEHRFVYRVRRGWAGRSRTLQDGRSQFILIFLPGDLFAVKSMYMVRHPDAVETLSDSVIEQIDYRVLRDAVDSDRDIALRCTWQLIEEERRLHSWVVSLGRGSAEERAALLLLDFRGRLILSRSIPDEALAYDLPMTQEQLGDHLGITTVHVNRVLKSLREAGLVTIRNYRVQILDLAGLAALAGPLLDTYERDRTAFSGEGEDQQVSRR